MVVEARSVESEVDRNGDVVGEPVARSIEAVGCQHLSHLSEVVANADVIDVWPLTDIASMEEIEIGE